MQNNMCACTHRVFVGIPEQGPAVIANRAGEGSKHLNLHLLAERCFYRYFNECCKAEVEWHSSLGHVFLVADKD